MNTGLQKYSINELAERVEGGADTGAQKAESILIAKTMVELANGMEVLQAQLAATGKDIRQIIGYKVEELTKSIDAFKAVIVDYSRSSDKYANAMAWFTGGLFFIGAVQLFIAIFKY